jgi:hypothetical protein
MFSAACRSPKVVGRRRRKVYQAVASGRVARQGVGVSGSQSERSIKGPLQGPLLHRRNILRERQEMEGQMEVEGDNRTHELQQALAYADNLIATLRELFVVLDKSLRVRTANARAWDG